MTRREEQKHVHDTLLTEADGDYRKAFENACARLVFAIHCSSFAYARRMDPVAETLKLDDGPPVCGDEWLVTGREA